MYEFLTVNEIENKLLHGVKRIDFTDDNFEDIVILGKEPTGWYGIRFSKEFDGRCFVIGYYGDGNLEVWNPDVESWTFGSAFGAWFYKEFDRFPDKICCEVYEGGKEDD